LFAQSVIGSKMAAEFLSILFAAIF